MCMYGVGPTLAFQSLKTWGSSCPWVVVPKGTMLVLPLGMSPRKSGYDLSLGGSPRIVIIYGHASFGALMVYMYIGGDQQFIMYKRMDEAKKK